MQIICQANDSKEMSRLIFSEKKKKKKYTKNLEWSATNFWG